MPRFTIFILLFLCACSNGKINTPKKFVNSVTVTPALYSIDSMAILSSLYSKIKNHEASFRNPEYFDSTRLYLDTILYDGTFDKIALFVIAENPIYRNPHSDTKLPFYYNANCYLGKRTYADSSIFELKNIGPASIINFDHRQSVSQAIREIYFSELTTYLDADGKPFWDFNLNDKRFWGGPKGWDHVFP